MSRDKVVKEPSAVELIRKDVLERRKTEMKQNVQERRQSWQVETHQKWKNKSSTEKLTTRPRTGYGDSK